MGDTELTNTGPGNSNYTPRSSFTGLISSHQQGTDGRGVISTQFFSSEVNDSCDIPSSV